ncbi:MAG: sodium:solute symporter family protein [Pirellulales bacterium]|nr:sodium:solute symporter family protein [Pirellulales bacterium]
MTYVDWLVLGGYFLMMAGIGVWAMRKVKAQEDFFMGGRSFGKVVQAFAAFGAGTGANDPVALGKTTFTSGLSGIWSVLLWLFITPFYWIFGVWYRRMRHLTLGDWFVERYESKGIGAAYALFAIYFYMLYLSVAFSAVGKVVASLVTPTVDLPLLGNVDVFFVVLPVMAVVIMVYGILGGLRAAYLTDMIQGVLIIVLSIILIPTGLKMLGVAAGGGILAGFTEMHNRLPADYFQIIGSAGNSEFPLYYIVAIVLLNLLGIVVQPHFIATGGGSAKSENAARVGLVAGNFLKRFCTVGWAFTGLIVLALFANDMTIVQDPDQAWGVASKNILGNVEIGDVAIRGLVGLMLACLLAALMSSADCYMLVASALVVRNIYAAYIKPDATEKAAVLAGRIVGVAIISGAMILAMKYRNVFSQLKATWEITAIFFGVFWVGIFWRRATKWAAWLTVVFSTLVFFLLPWFLGDLIPSLRQDQRFAGTNQIVESYALRPASTVDVERRDAVIAMRDEIEHAHVADPQEAPEKRFAPVRNALSSFGFIPTQFRIPEGIENASAAQRILDWYQPGTDGLSPDVAQFAAGDQILVRVTQSGGKSIFWTGPPKPIVRADDPEYVNDAHIDLTEVRIEGDVTYLIMHRRGEYEGTGNFNLDFLLYQWIGLDLTSRSNAMLETLRLPPKIITPFVIMIVFSVITPRNRKEALDRYYVKMRTPVEPDPSADKAALEESYANPSRFDNKKLFPTSSLEFNRPSLTDIVGFLVSLAICFLILWFAVWLANYTP